MSIALLVITDGRGDCLKQTIPSALAMLEGPITHRMIFDDSGDAEYRRWIFQSFPTFELFFEPGRKGFGGAIQAAWNHLKRYDKFEYVFHLEDDFLFHRPVPLVDMMKVLDDHPYLYQLALKRQPWNDTEKQAGGIIEQHPGDYTQKESWIEHRRFFTTNPTLYRRSLMDIGWPSGIHSEGHFTHKILNMDPEAQFAFWGHRADEPWVQHIGARQGTGY
jgi:hypothetical protein